MAQDPSGSSEDPKDKQRANGPAPTGKTAAGTAARARRRQAGGRGDRSGADRADPAGARRRRRAADHRFAGDTCPEFDCGGLSSDSPPVTVAFPPCSDVLLALINRQIDAKGRHHQVLRTVLHASADHEIVFAPAEQLDSTQVLDPGLLSVPVLRPTSERRRFTPRLAPALVPAALLRDAQRQPPPGRATRHCSDIKRLFLGDLLWLFFFERMGIFKILGVILDDFATRGGFPISNGSLDATEPA